MTPLSPPFVSIRERDFYRRCAAAWLSSSSDAPTAEQRACLLDLIAAGLKASRSTAGAASPRSGAR